MKRKLPAAAVTVADEFRRAGLLEECGGGEFLLELQQATPAISNASQYAKIVRDTSALRRLLAAGAAIINDAYSGGDPHLVGLRALDLVQQTVVAPAGKWQIFANMATLVDLDGPTAKLLVRNDGIGPSKWATSHEPTPAA